MRRLSVADSDSLCVPSNSPFHFGPLLGITLAGHGEDLVQVFRLALRRFEVYPVLWTV